ncbi:GNAT family N-acetyltransferase [Ferrimicrobium sp.]|uniref:GNAT family N-acetyltransferase n=1 Tax=Ferrimicrobium sp. TaxID=2926050 RepID=UPI0026065884|nr:GNAT family N-acetyltransferase [Ferrimicrobium sp.]
MSETRHISLKVTPDVEGLGLIGYGDLMSNNPQLPDGARVAASLTDPPRRARLSDVDEVIRLASLMYEEMGMDTSKTEWRQAAAEHVRRRLGDELMVFVVENPTHPGHLVATGAGSIAARLPGPNNPSARVGYIQWISTDVAWRRRGLARAITVALINWFGDQQVRAVELHATQEAEPLYRALGFDQGTNPGLRVRLDRPTRLRVSEN